MIIENINKEEFIQIATCISGLEQLEEDGILFFSLDSIAFLYDYLQEKGKNIEIEMGYDGINEYAERTIQEVLVIYELKDLEELKSKTEVLRVNSDNTIIYKIFPLPDSFWEVVI